MALAVKGHCISRHVYQQLPGGLGGEVIIYAPHLTEVSYTHGLLIDEVGYHVRDYFLK